LLLDLLAGLLQFAARDDVAIDLGGDLFDHLDIGGEGQRQSRRPEYYKPAKHHACAPILPCSWMPCGADLQVCAWRPRPAVRSGSKGRPGGRPQTERSALLK